MRISDWSSDVCSSDLREAAEAVDDVEMFLRIILEHRVVEPAEQPQRFALIADVLAVLEGQAGELAPLVGPRSEEHTSELQSLMRTSYAVLCLKKKKKTISTSIKHEMTT